MSPEAILFSSFVVRSESDDVVVGWDMGRSSTSVSHGDGISFLLIPAQSLPLDVLNGHDSQQCNRQQTLCRSMMGRSEDHAWYGDDAASWSNERKTRQPNIIPSNRLIGRMQPGFDTTDRQIILAALVRHLQNGSRRKVYYL